MNQSHSELSTQAVCFLEKRANKQNQRNSRCIADFFTIVLILGLYFIYITVCKQPFVNCLKVQMLMQIFIHLQFLTDRIR